MWNFTYRLGFTSRTAVEQARSVKPIESAHCRATV